MELKKSITHFNWALFFSFLIIFLIGVFNLYSASSLMTEEGIKTFSYYKKQMVWGVIGMGVLIFMFLLDYNKIKNYVWFIYGASIVLLVWVLLFGSHIKGARRWIDLKFFSLQPSEIAKFAVIVTLAYMLSEIETISWKNFFKITLIALVPALLIIIQPDLGSGLVLLLIASMMMLYRGVKEYVFWSVIYLIPIGLPIFWHFLSDYQKTRLLILFNSNLDPYGAGYNIRQAQIAVGSGQIWGNGYLKGAQSQLLFLPEKHTDFVWAVFAEEWGFVGCLVLISLFCIFLYYLANVIKDTKDDFGRFLAVGIFFFFFWHIFINIGMVLKIFPVVGLPLPFMSYGGSFTILSFALIGLSLNIFSRKFIFK